MKIFFLTTLFFFISGLKAQKKKDTLFFNIDKYYTISPTITSNLSQKTYWDKVEYEKEQIKHTKTNGYVFFIGDGFLTKGLKPKKILSIKDFIENRKFYLDGKYNKIVDERKLQDSLTNKYTIFFVNGDEFIGPRQLLYYSYFPIRQGDKSIENKMKDTLFFKLDNEYVYKSKDLNNGSSIYLIKDSSKSEVFYFQELERINNLKPNEILSLKKYVRASRFYNENDLHKLSEVYFMKFLKDYVIYLTSGKNEYIKVEPFTVMED